MNRRLFWVFFWIGFFIALGLIDYTISLWNNDFTLSKILLWFETKSAVTYFGLTFMLGYLVGHLQVAQEPLDDRQGEKQDYALRQN